MGMSVTNQYKTTGSVFLTARRRRKFLVNLDGFSQQNETKSWKSSTKHNPYPPGGRGVVSKKLGIMTFGPGKTRDYSPMVERRISGRCHFRAFQLINSLSLGTKNFEIGQ